jgi:pyroglutamyl-peptidase
LVFHAPVPVEFNGAWKNIREILDKSGEVGGVLALGQAETRSRISLERVALNWTDARMPDNAGFVPAQAPIQHHAPNMHWSNIPWENFELSAHCERSYSAGTYVCNSVMFQALDWALAHKKKAGFVHIPVLSSQKDPVFAKSPRLDDQAALEETARILEFVLKL